MYKNKMKKERKDEKMQHRSNERRAISEKIMSENSAKLVKNTNNQIQDIVS